jgi:HSP20 family molecular chaperone IbpA
MSVGDVDKLHARQLDGIRRKNERELKFVKDSHDTMKAEQKKQNDAEIVDIQHEHHQHISSEQAKKEKLLQDMRGHLEQTKTLTDRQLAELEVEKAKDQNQIATRLQDQRERLVNDHELYLEDINHRFNNKTNEVLSDGRSRIDSMEQSQTDAYNIKQDEYQKKINHQRSHFTTKYRADEENFKKVKDSQDRTYKKERMSQNVRQNHELEKMTKTHNSSKNLRHQEFKRDVASQEEFFEKRYTDVRGKHEADFQRLNDLNKKLVNENKASLVKEISLQKTRAQDPFFEFTELRPTLKETEEGVQIQVEVPDHAKNDLVLSVNNKDVLLTFNRRYKDVVKNEQGESRIDKVESLSSKVKTNHHLNPKSLKAQYDNGVMTYTIKKA